MNNQSDQINELAAALAKAQAQIVGAKKDSSNPFFKSSYADLASVWDAIRDPLTKNNLSIVQTVDQGAIESLGEYLVTTLVHSSGQWIRGVQKILTKDQSPQAQGSGITYARRYGLAAIVGVAQIDDDGNAAQGNGNQTRQAQSGGAIFNKPAVGAAPKYQGPARPGGPVVTKPSVPYQDELPDFGNTENPADLPKRK